MTKKTKTTAIGLSIIALVIIGGLYFLYTFFSAFASPKIKMTTDYISTNRDFINGVSIEKIQVDSIGDKGYPVKYTVIYTTSCVIRHPIGRPPDPPDRIAFDKPGNYFWDEDTVEVPYIHKGLSRRSLDTTNRLWWLDKFGNHAICPLKFEREQWYFITVGNPQVTGIFFYIDRSGKEHQYFLASGVSPI